MVSSYSKCGARAHYWKHHTGICELPPHDEDVEHLIDVVTIETSKTDYSRGGPVRVYTDGGYRGEIGGWGWWNESTDEKDYGSVFPATNQRMELQAAMEAIDTFLSAPDLTIVSDSAYLVNTMQNHWYKRWHMNGWKNSKGEPVANRDLWEAIAVFTQENPRVKFEKVKGHSGVHGNEMADKLATQGIIDYIETRKKINELRELIHIHSIIYYHMHTSVVPNSSWDRWSLELRVLQKNHPEMAKFGYEAEAFSDWTGDTGMHLPRGKVAVQKAQELVDRMAA